MDNNYLTFMNNMITIKEQLEKNNSDSYKKILDAVKDFIEAVDSINKLNPKEAKEFQNIVLSALTASMIGNN